MPTIKNVMRNLTLQPGDRAMFRCKVDMKCMVSYIQWYHEMNNGDTLAQCRHMFIHLSTSGSVRLLRTGATAGTPYSYMINKVREGEEGSGFAEVISRLFLCSFVRLLDINFLCRKYHVGLSGLDLYRNI